MNVASAMRRGAALLIGAAALAVGAAQVQPQSAAIRTGLPPNVRRGQQVFLEYCAMCHGNAGKGDGELAAALRRRAGAVVADLTRPTVAEQLGRAGIRRTIAEGGAHTGRSNLMPAWGRLLSARQLDDVTDFVMRLPDLTPSISSATLQAYLGTPPGVPAAGRSIFVHQCAACHGLTAHGDGPLSGSLIAQRHVRPRNLTDSSYVATRTDRDLFAVISEGGGPMGKSNYMPHWGGYLTPSQIKNLVGYVRAISHTAARP